MNRVQIAVLGVTVLAFAGAYVLFNSGQAPAPQVVQVTPKLDTDEVLVAARDLPMGTQLTEPDFTWQKWPTQKTLPNKTNGSGGGIIPKIKRVNGKARNCLSFQKRFLPMRFHKRMPRSS